jgi:hypothetical protein
MIPVRQKNFYRFRVGLCASAVQTHCEEKDKDMNLPGQYGMEGHGHHSQAIAWRMTGIRGGCHFFETLAGLALLIRLKISSHAGVVLVLWLRMQIFWLLSRKICSHGLAVR